MRQETTNLSPTRNFSAYFRTNVWKAFSRTFQILYAHARAFRHTFSSKYTHNWLLCVNSWLYVRVKMALLSLTTTIRRYDICQVIWISLVGEESSTLAGLTYTVRLAVHSIHVSISEGNSNFRSFVQNKRNLAPFENFPLYGDIMCVGENPRWSIEPVYTHPQGINLVHCTTM